MAQLLETLNNALQYQYEGNSPLVYCVLRRHGLFERLRDVLPSSVAGAAVAAGGPGASGRARPSDATASAADEAARVHAAAEIAAAAGAAGAAPVSSSGPQAVGAGEAPAAGGWVATDAWWRQERASLPLGTVLRLIAYLRPRVEAMIAGTDGGVEDTAVSALRFGSTARCSPSALPGALQLPLSAIVRS